MGNADRTPCPYTIGMRVRAKTREEINSDPNLCRVLNGIGLGHYSACGFNKIFVITGIITPFSIILDKSVGGINYWERYIPVENLKWELLKEITNGKE